MTVTSTRARNFKAASRRIDQRIENVYRVRCSGIQINIMDIGKVFAEGRKAIADGADDQVLGDRIVAFVDTIRKN